MTELVDVIEMMTKVNLELEFDSESGGCSGIAYTVLHMDIQWLREYGYYVKNATISMGDLTNYLVKDGEWFVTTTPEESERLSKEYENSALLRKYKNKPMTSQFRWV